MRISDWSSDVCSSDLTGGEPVAEQGAGGEHMIGEAARVGKMLANAAALVIHEQPVQDIGSLADRCRDHLGCERRILIGHMAVSLEARDVAIFRVDQIHRLALLGSKRSEEHTSELQSPMRTSYAVFCLKKKINIKKTDTLAI